MCAQYNITTLKHLYKEIDIETFERNQNGMLNNVHITNSKTGKFLKNRKGTNKPNI